MDREIRIVPRDGIPLIQEIEQAGEVHVLGELRDFRWNDLLRSFMPDATQFAISWVELGPGEVLQPHTHPIQTMLVISAGSGGMLGDLCRPLTKGDIVVVPPGCAHGFVGGPDRLSGLSIQFGEGLYANPEKARVIFSGDGSEFETTVKYHQSRLDQYLGRPIFQLLTDGTLEDPDKRQGLLEILRRWLTAYQRALTAFQASSPQDISASVEGAVTRVPRAEGVGQSDPLLEAFADWFTYRMYVLDSHEKAAVLHLVLGDATEALFRPAESALGSDEDLWRICQSVLGHDGREHCLRQLRSQPPGAHQRVREVVVEAWDMLEAMSDRAVALTRA